MSIIENTWRVVLSTRDPSGTPYENVYKYVTSNTREDAIDLVLERYVGISGGERFLMSGWFVVSAWAVREEHVGDEVVIQPIAEPIFRRRP